MKERREGDREKQALVVRTGQLQPHATALEPVAGIVEGRGKRQRRAILLRIEAEDPADPAGRTWAHIVKEVRDNFHRVCRRELGLVDQRGGRHRVAFLSAERVEAASRVLDTAARVHARRAYGQILTHCRIEVPTPFLRRAGALRPSDSIDRTMHVGSL